LDAALQYFVLYTPFSIILRGTELHIIGEKPQDTYLIADSTPKTRIMLLSVVINFTPEKPNLELFTLKYQSQTQSLSSHYAPIRLTTLPLLSTGFNSLAFAISTPKLQPVALVA
jgi:hypothetical protein